MQHAIAITGAGVVSPVGETKEAVWQSVCSGVDLRGEWPRGDLSRYPHPSVIAVAAHDSEANFGLTGAWAKRAVDAALLQARFGQTPRRRVGCVAASTTAGVEVLERELIRSVSALSRNVSQYDGSRLLGALGREWNGPTALLSTACSSGLLASALAFEALECGEADAMVSVAVDVLLEYTVCGFNGLRLTTHDRCRPFSSERKGVVLSEGAVGFVFERLTDALRRNAPILGLLLGYAANCDAGQATAPSAKPIARAMLSAMKSAAVRASEIGGIFAHGTASALNDRVEAEALRLAFGDVVIPPVTAIKSVLGHAQAAAGAFSLLTALVALSNGVLPPTAGLGTLDAEFSDLCVPGAEPVPLQASTLMVNAFGFGGNNCVVIVAEPAGFA